MQLTHEQSGPVAEATDAPPTARRRLDPLVVVVGAVSLVTYLLGGLEGRLTRDLGVYAYAGERVLAGEPPYVGIVNRAGPLAHLLPVPGILAARLVGKDDVLGMRAWYVLIAVGCVVLAYVVGRDLFTSRLAGLVAAATMLSFEGFIALATTGPREKTPMVLFILCAIWALSHRRWLLTGIAISLATLTLQVAFFPLLAAAVVAVLMAGTGRLRGFGMVALGGAIPVAVLVPYFAAYGAVSDLLEGFVILNAKYSSGRSLTSRAGGLYADLHEGFGVTLWLLLGGLLLLVVVTALRLADRRTRREPTTATLLALTVCLVFSLLWTEIDYDSWVDTFPFLPLAAIGIGAGLAELGRRVSPRVVAVVGALAVVLPTIVAFQFAISTRNNDLTEQRATTRNVISHLPNATIWSIEAPEYLVLADRANPTRYQLFSEGLQYHLDDTWPGGLDGFVRWNLDRKPELIALSLDEMKDGHWRSRIGSDYVEVARSPAIMWLANRSVGHEVIHSIRSADRRLHERFGDES